MIATEVPLVTVPFISGVRALEPEMATLVLCSPCSKLTNVPRPVMLTESGTLMLRPATIVDVPAMLPAVAPDPKLDAANAELPAIDVLRRAMRPAVAASADAPEKLARLPEACWVLLMVAASAEVPARSPGKGVRRLSVAARAEAPVSSAFVLAEPVGAPLKMLPPEKAASVLATAVSTALSAPDPMDPASARSV